MGTNVDRWMVYFMENPIKMDDLGVHHTHLGNMIQVGYRLI
jgi:hypothetical protein